eukprot:CAMPEP_0177663092 /NCGR_PEP_ID=MMETSP0447-20121125/19726_1 /TAXON_ID=0 /ORGANISM="Stygamoeba regulata, Strain BSH-02190019" /LENGTH=76 /DNA_ID=CAMNT_0019168875 /DNA_START=118 /DNA_END=348 /DNA_ORIENTATION=-
MSGFTASAEADLRCTCRDQTASRRGEVEALQHATVGGDEEPRGSVRIPLETLDLALDGPGAVLTGLNVQYCHGAVM